VTSPGQGEGPVVACSLSTTDLAARHKQAAELFDEGLTAADHYGDTLELRFRERYESRIEALAAAERECCPFMDIDVRREGREVVLLLDCPPEAAKALDPFASLAADALAA
jgi:hypothetical protein